MQAQQQQQQQQVQIQPFKAQFKQQPNQTTLSHQHHSQQNMTVDIPSSGNIEVLTHVFEHGLMPPPSKLSIQIIINLFSSIYSQTKSATIKINDFKMSAIKHIPNISHRDAEVYFLTYLLLIQEKEEEIDDNSNINNANNNINALHLNQKQASIEGLAIYLFVQLYQQQVQNRSTHFFNDQKKVKDQQIYNASWLTVNTQSNQQFASPLNSPRIKTTINNSIQGEDYNQILLFIKYNIKLILKLATRDLKNDNLETITYNEFKHLHFLINLGKNNQIQKDIKILFKNGQPADINNLAQWFGNNAMLMDQQQQNHIIIDKIAHSVTTKDYEQCLNKDIRISQCEDSYILINSPVHSLIIQNCFNLTVFVSAVSQICSIDKCENVAVTVSANFLRIGNTIDSRFFVYGSLNPVLYGDCRSVTLAPNNANSADMIDHIIEARIPITIQAQNQFKTPIIWNNNTIINYTVLDKADFLVLELPEFKFQTCPYQLAKQPLLQLAKNRNDPFNKNAKDNVATEKIIIPLLAPQEYKESILLRCKSFVEFQSLLKHNQLQKEEQQSIQFYIQGQFKEWLVQSGQTKGISELVKQIDSND